MGFIDNMKSVFSPQKIDTSIKYGSSKEWFFSAAGRKVFAEAKTTVELNDYIYNYLKVIKKSESCIEDEILYKIAFIFADAIIDSDQEYSGKENILNNTVNPFVAYLEHLNRSLSSEFLCYELLMVLFGAVNPFDSSEWIYDNSRRGYSEEEYSKFAEEHDIDIRKLLKIDYTGREGFRLIMCEIIWLIGEDKILDKIR